eukprot:355524-Chlamydomonas_euryale.AAC.47
MIKQCHFRPACDQCRIGVKTSSASKIKAPTIALALVGRASRTYDVIAWWPCWGSATSGSHMQHRSSPCPKRVQSENTATHQTPMCATQQPTRPQCVLPAARLYRHLRRGHHAHHLCAHRNRSTVQTKMRRALRARHQLGCESGSIQEEKKRNETDHFGHPCSKSDA